MIRHKTHTSISLFPVLTPNNGWLVILPIWWWKFDQVHILSQSSRGKWVNWTRSPIYCIKCNWMNLVRYILDIIYLIITIHFKFPKISLNIMIMKYCKNEYQLQSTMYPIFANTIDCTLALDVKTGIYIYIYENWQNMMLQPPQGKTWKRLKSSIIFVLVMIRRVANMSSLIRSDRHTLSPITYPFHENDASMLWLSLSNWVTMCSTAICYL